MNRLSFFGRDLTLDNDLVPALGLAACSHDKIASIAVGGWIQSSATPEAPVAAARLSMRHPHHDDNAADQSTGEDRADTYGSNKQSSL